MEDIINFDGSNSTYKRQGPLQSPPLMSPTSVSPRFDNFGTRSVSGPWSPAPLHGNQYEPKTVDPVTPSYRYSKTSDPWISSNVYPKPSDPWASSNAYRNASDQSSLHNASSKTSDQWKPAYGYPRTNDHLSPNNSFSRPMDSTMTSNNSSTMKMINSSDRTFGSKTEWCSPRCKLGILGFIIGVLAVGIALAVVLVLWLRQ